MALVQWWHAQIEKWSKFVLLFPESIHFWVCGVYYYFCDCDFFVLYPYHMSPFLFWKTSLNRCKSWVSLLFYSLFLTVTASWRSKAFVSVLILVYTVIIINFRWYWLIYQTLWSSFVLCFGWNFVGPNYKHFPFNS